MQSRQGAQCRCNGTDFVPNHEQRTLTRFGGRLQDGEIVALSR